MRKLGMSGVSLAVLLLLSGVTFSQQCTDPGSIMRAKNTSIGGYEYVVFDLVMPVNTGYSHTVTTVTPPFTEDPSGNTVVVAGSKFKQIRFQAITWTCTINETFSLPKPAIKGIKKISQFEGIVEYVVGYRNSSTYKSTYYFDVGSIRKVVMKFKK